MKIMNNNFHRFRKFRQFSDLFSQIKLNYRQMSSFSGICREIPTKLHQKLSEKIQKRKQKTGKSKNEYSFIRSLKNVDNFWLNIR